jgi:hypothetical protein
VPWDDIFRSAAVYATALSHFASNWTHYTMLTCLPLYLHKVHRFNVDAVSMITSSGGNIFKNEEIENLKT